MSARKRILCVGRVYCDLVFRSDALPAWGHEVFSQGFDSVAGGGAFITAAYLSALGHDVYLAGSAGSVQPFGAIITRDVKACGIDGRYLQFGQSPQVTVAVAGVRDRAFITHRDPLTIDVPDMDQIDHIHVGELTSLVDSPGLVDLARRTGASLSSDCGDEADYPTQAQALLEALDVFAPSASELMRLETLGFDLSAIPTLVVKQGADGARMRRDGPWAEVPAHPAQLVDSTGAGDAFNAGFLHGWINGAPDQTCLSLGARLGALAVAHMGGWAGLKQLDPAAMALT